MINITWWLSVLFYGVTSFAATLPLSQTKQAASFDVKGSASVFSDGGVGLYSATSISNVVGFTLSKTNYKFDIMAYGSAAGGKYPLMKIYIDTTLIASIDVNKTASSLFSFTYLLQTSGNRSVRLEFSNDETINGQDRNLFIQSMRVSLVAPATNVLLQDAVNDMTVKNDYFALNVNKSFDWAIGPKLGYGSNPRPEWKAMVPWGEIFKGETNTVSNPRAEIKNVEVWVLRKSTNTWSQIMAPTSNISGALYDPTYSNVNRPAIVSAGSDGGQKVLVEGWPYHFYTSRQNMPSDIGGLFVRIQARLSTDTPSSAVVLIHMAADYWLSTTAPFKADYSNNGDAMISRLDRLTSQWRYINAHTLTATQLKANPPPFLK